jgi:hypothetical protein
MIALLNAPLTTRYKLTSDLTLPAHIQIAPDCPAPAHIQVAPDRHAPIHIQFDDGMSSRHTCPCCASPLLRHISHSHVCWRCSDCRASMAVWRQWG